MLNGTRLKMYKCLLHHQLKDAHDYQIVPIRQEDIELIRLWRNAQMDILRQQKSITYEEQQAYFQEVIRPSFDEQSPKQLLFSFLLQEQCIGYGGLTYVDWISLRAEISFLVNPVRIQHELTYKRDFLHFLDLICRLAFEHLQFHRLFGETFAFRLRQIEILEEFGFKREGILREHVYKRHQWVDSVMQGLLSHEWSPVRYGKMAFEEVPATTEYSAVLVTSISKKMPLLNAVRSATIKSGKFTTIHGCDSASFCIGEYGVDQFWHCPSLETISIEQIISYCHENRITAIIPTRNADLEFYAEHLPFFRKRGIHAMVSSPETILTCLDKKNFADTLSKQHFPVIPTFLSIEEFQSPLYVVKERRGAGSQQLGLRLTRELAWEHSGQLKEPVFQPFIAGKEYSVDVYRSFVGCVRGCVARQRDFVVQGESQVTTTRHLPLLENLCQEMADHLNIHGHAIFQCIEDEKGEYHVIECNPRFGGASTASLAVGLDSFFWFFLECSGECLQNYPFIRSQGDIRQIRYMTDRILHGYCL